MAICTFHSFTDYRTISHRHEASYVALQNRSPQGRDSGALRAIPSSGFHSPISAQGRAQVAISLGPSERPSADPYCHMAPLILALAQGPHNHLHSHFRSLWLLPPCSHCTYHPEAVAHDFLISFSPILHIWSAPNRAWNMTHHLPQLLDTQTGGQRRKRACTRTAAGVGGP